MSSVFAVVKVRIRRHEESTFNHRDLRERHEMTSKLTDFTGKKEKSGSRSGFLSGMKFTLCAVLVMLATAFANAQSTGRGTILGIVTDSSGAVISGAQITATNLEMNVSQTTVSNSTGYYEIESLNPGTYKIAVSAQGFDNLLREGVTLAADARENVPMSLTVGRAVHTVVVNADATLLNTESGSNGQVLSTIELENVPAEGENPLWLAWMAPGVTSTLAQTSSRDGTLNWTGVGQFGLNGVSNDNEFSLDGAPNFGNQREEAINVSEDEIDQMKLDTTGFEASVGHTLGVAVTQTTKSGTNDIHGVIRELYQDRRWAAMGHFQGLNYRYQQQQHGCTGPNTPECFELENQYGWPGVHENNGSGSVGGPVFIPKLYDGRNKFFFFVSILDDVYADAGSSNITLPTLQERTGNFNDLLGIDPNAVKNTPSNWNTASSAGPALCPGGQPYYGQYQLYNPFSTVLTSSGHPSRQPFCGNVIPSELVGANNAAMVKLYNSLLPAPNANNPAAADYTYSATQPQTFRQFSQRMDYALSQNDHIYFRWTRAHYTKQGNGFTNGNVDVQQGPRWIETGALGYNHVFSARTDMDLTVGATNFETWCCYYPGYEAFKPSSVGLPASLDTYAGSLSTLPIFSVNSYQQVGQLNNAPDYYRTLAYRGNVTHVQGKHTIRFGAEWREQNLAQGIQGNQGGTYTFDDTYTQQNDGSNSAFQQTNIGLSYAAFLLGVPTTSAVSQQSSYSLHSPYYAFYVGDSWRVSPKLTVIPGIRYEYEYGVSEKENRLIVGWDSTASLPIAAAANTAYQAALAAATPAQQAVLPSSLTIQGGPIYAKVNGAPSSIWPNSLRVLPRIAFTYQVTPSTVIRAGYGLFFDTLNALELPEGNLPDQDGFSASTSIPSSNNYGANFNALGYNPLANPFPTGFNQPIGSAGGSMYYAGANPTIYDRAHFRPARANRGSVSVQHQFGSSTEVEVAWVGQLTTDTSVSHNVAFAPQAVFAGGNQPNNVTNTLMGSKLTNPFNLANFSALQASNPIQYSLIARQGLFTSTTDTVGGLIRGYSQMGGLTLQQSIGETKFEQVQINLHRRLNHGLVVTASLQFNDHHDRDYFYNPFDPSPSWEPSNNSEPYRFTAEGVYDLPLGHGRSWFTSGWKSAIFGGFRINASYEKQPGTLIGFSNLFYIGNTSNIKLNHKIYNDGLFTGGHNYIQWFNVGNVVASPETNSSGTVIACTYTGTGFVTNSSCQPNGYNLRVFPTRVNGIRSQGPNDVNVNVQRNFHLTERFGLETRIAAFNVFNEQFAGGPTTSPTSSNFGQVTGDGYQDGSPRWLAIQGRLRF